MRKSYRSWRPRRSARFSNRRWTGSTTASTCRTRRPIPSRSCAGSPGTTTGRSWRSAQPAWHSAGVERAQSIQRLVDVMGESPPPSCGASNGPRRGCAAVVRPSVDRGADIVALLWVLHQMLQRSGSLESFFWRATHGEDVREALDSFSSRAMRICGPPMARRNAAIGRPQVERHRPRARSCRAPRVCPRRPGSPSRKNHSTAAAPIEHLVQHPEQRDDVRAARPPMDERRSAAPSRCRLEAADELGRTLAHHIDAAAGSTAARSTRGRTPGRRRRSRRPPGRRSREYRRTIWIGIGGRVGHVEAVVQPVEGRFEMAALRASALGHSRLLTCRTAIELSCVP